MTTKERTAVERRALELARQLAEEVYGPNGPAMDSSIDDIEEVAMQAVRAAFDGVIARALELQNEQLPTELPCPDCGGACVVEFEKRTIQGRFGTAEIQEPLGHCARCARDFFPSASRAAVG
jgi:hypothetical protein